MSSSSHRLDQLVLSWVRFYTLGLDPEYRRERSAEIESDLWEHRNQAALDGEASSVTHLTILGRWAAGLTADLSWRASRGRRAPRVMKENSVRNGIVKHWWRILAALTAAATFYAGVSQFASDDVTVGVSAGKVAALVILVAASLLTLAGIAVHSMAPRQGSLMVMIGVLPAALVGGFGLGILLGVVASLVGGLGWWWVPVGMVSAVASAAGIGALSSWWHAKPSGQNARGRLPMTPFAVMLVGLLAAGVGVGIGWMTIPLIGVGALAMLLGARMWNRRSRPNH